MDVDAANWVGSSLDDGRYQVTALLGAGGMGQVYRAHATRLDTDVVLKVPHRAMLEKPTALARFRREIRALVKLSHPHIVKVLDVGEHDGLPYLVMQFLPGGDLAEQMQLDLEGHCPPLPLKGLGTWLPHIAEALDYLHQQGVVHRDVKPGNILFDVTGQAFLSDFGLIGASHDSNWLQSTALTQVGQYMGTPMYTGPEIGQTKPDGRLDQYALAVTVYQWLAGRPPFEGPFQAVMIQHLTQPPPDPREFVPRLPQGAALALLRALAKKPADRFPSCLAFTRALVAGSAAGQSQTATATMKPDGGSGLPPVSGKRQVTVGGAQVPTTIPAATLSPDAGPAAPLSQRLGDLYRPALLVAISLAVLSLGGCLVFTLSFGLLRATRAIVQSTESRSSSSRAAAVTIAKVPTTPPVVTRIVTPTVPEKEFTNSIGMKLVLIPAGTFTMGSPRDEKARFADEDEHEVEITQPFYLGVHEVTQGDYERVMGVNPSHFSPMGPGQDQVRTLDTRRLPVESVSWDAAMEFCRRLSAEPKEREAGRTYRLPTEAEWEYACRAGARNHTVFHFGNDLSSDLANFDGNYPFGDAAKGPYLERTTRAGSYAPNAFGLYDLHGNVWEWCADWYHEDYHLSSPRRDPKGPDNGSSRVLRGGSWYNNAHYCRAANRLRNEPGSSSWLIGFRVAVASPSP